MHLGNKSQIELQPEQKSSDYPPIEKFTAKITGLNSNSGNVHIVGTVKAVYGKNTFPKSDNTDGVVMRLALRDDSGETVVVIWNEKVEEIERTLRESSRLLLVNARVKETQKGAVEVHVDSNTSITALKSQQHNYIKTIILPKEKSNKKIKRKNNRNSLNFCYNRICNFCARRWPPKS